ncbi:ABC transporter ATP-binding protein [Streptomyces sp. NPDC056716]|uniref:ABC transporter ATP-binding protein n=1 Tax=unclassified Streptomyces TaxID=2593676 RepID=UPI0036CF6C5E
MHSDTTTKAGAASGEAGEVLLSVQGLSRSFAGPDGERLVLGGIDLEVRRGEFLCVVGPSGAGKTTFLRCVAGLMRASGGAVLLDGQTVESPPPALAVVFQDYSRSLMPWMSVAQNVMLPLRSKGLPKRERRERAREALDAVGLVGSAAQYPWQLSGGMQQRVAIARALAYEPEALLMDEPFASVDAQTRADLEDLILGVRERFGVTVILVTHDIDEAVYLGDTVVVLSGTPTRVRATITIGLGRHRDQLTTKALPRFGELRTRILGLIRKEASPAPEAS